MATTLTVGEYEYQINVSPYEVEQIEAELGVNVYDVVAEKTAKDFIIQLEENDALIANLTWIICRDEAKEKGVSEKQFKQGCIGDTLDFAYVAFLEGLSRFFRNPVQRRTLEEMVKLIKATTARINKVALKQMDGVDTEKLAEAFCDGATKSLANLGSTLNQRIATELGDTT